MATIAAPDIAERPITPVDVSANALYTENRWHDPFAELRRTMPLSYRPDSPFGGYWSAVTYDLVQQIEIDHATFSSAWDRGNITIADGVGEVEFPNFIAQDPPIHTAQRKVIAPAFSPSQMGAREKQVVERCRMLLDALPQGETFDWVEQVSIPMTIGMLLILFDMPYDEWRDIKRWSDWASGVSADNLTDEYRAEFMVQMGAMLARFDRELEDRRAKEPTDDLLSRMIHSEAMGNMSPMERIANIALLIVGGNDTTRNSMSGMVEALDRFPDQLDVLHGDRSLVPNAAQEIIRWQSPVTHMRRTATCDTELAGQRIREGEKIVMWYISANRDENVFEDADRFDVTRKNARRHLGFGAGIHRCVGARLAEIQIGTLITEIVERNWRIVPQAEPTRLASPFLHGFTQMPVRIETRG
ncbi:cytochrome P450 [Qipengyuania oceanensis]|uniref:Cytochrome P450 n=1 Tax=Qipengyuania oceanensis TaxID=1463597 RepID=A0A844YHP7_9SPHN|nr:cytochrome P450 [Qipengyuania oceanensis]MXO62548.1 cytochrome P450 [Qipengyuania oceanensis]